MVFSKYRITLIIFFIPLLSYTQYWGGQEINESDLTNWVTQFEIEYTGTYHFGESESESDLNLFFSGDLIIGQIKGGYWEEKTGIRKTNYINLTNISIDNEGKFTSDQHSGQFINYKMESGDFIKGLKINDPWTIWIEDSKFDVGTRTQLKFENIHYGKYREASSRILATDELNKISSDDLRLMRNEIFARYGYVFKKGGEMDLYFRSQEWYRAEHKKVAQYLTEIELYNIELIRKEE